MATNRRTNRAAQDNTTPTRPAGNYHVMKKGVPDSPHIKAMKDFNERKQLPDPFKDYYDAGTEGEDLRLIHPTYNVHSLIRLPKENNILRQCVDAMVTNTVGHGYRLAYIGPDGGEESPEAIAERDRLNDFLKHVNDEQSIVEVLERVKSDKEIIGYGCLEVGRDKSGRIAMLAHVPAHTVRKTLKEGKAIEVTVELPRDGKIIKHKTKKRFSRFVQIVGNRKVYFKEFGDPRTINPENGKEDPSLPMEAQATEILMDAIYTQGDPYGLPRWIGQMPSVLGSREAELTNLDYFKENAVPAMAILVAGGLIPQETLDALYDLFNNVRGRKSQHRVVVIEAEGDHRAAAVDGSMPVPKIELKPLQNERQKDGMFKDYEEFCQLKVRSAFRLPSVFTGHSQDYTYASAKTSFEVADSQVFAPERNKTDDFVNIRLLAGFAPKYWAFRLQPPRISDPEEITRALKVFDSMGALTPNLSIGMANEYFDLDIAKIKEVWGDYPFEVVKLLVQQGRLKGMDDIADELQKVPMGGTDDPNAEPGRPEGIGPDDQQDSPDDDTSGTEKKMMLVRDALVGLRQVLRAA